ncbi:MAG TPA: hypothetical protein PK735_15175 [Flavobacteriales bacterium]|nr:hypothetical protein [Flavobacteriales bacterium]
MSLYELPAYKEGCGDARKCTWLSREPGPNEFNNPYPEGSENCRAWNLGWNTTLRAEQP